MLLDSYWCPCHDSPERFWCRSDAVLVLLADFRSSNGGGTQHWSPMPQIFPRGLTWLHEQTGFRWQLHNRYWASDCDYAT